ncbi:hypothetical protein LOZ57_006413 [Ophidiomyces ophidiicola]|uniref:uncharacterized protein n=1 Tax=Ophidiomyces ophidiicola TaxID=1387563 RepID=UPI0020C56298|nr:uncharacterized protein LOZ57_006413 [Ophidiomyces ophidiicola]KAI1938245.1 hypothetical protein LOZ57_006413 [Ophidiomyces ophidiicola]KAI2057053.1 hypothetical protein LOZ43_003277 [Ophidiomyces ophidiicola]KAI2085286.1 hypothetical protein LOZ36_004104 [Ophidiomyces ophidiicola]
MVASVKQENKADHPNPPTDGLRNNHEPASNPAGDGWGSEKQLVSALSRLQEMEGKIQKLRTLVPNRIWSPLVPMVADKKDGSLFLRPKSPQDLFDQLGQSAREANDELEAFKASWNSPEMEATRNIVNRRLKESGGEYPYTTGTWERDYVRIFKQLDAEDQRKEEEKRRESAEEERRRFAPVGNDWNGIVESFAANAKPGLAVKLRPSADNLCRFNILLQKASVAFSVWQINDSAGTHLTEWGVATESRPNSKVGLDILANIQSRDRKWDLKYLLVSKHDLEVNFD